MSNHFTYEIDERNLRMQMKEFVIPVKEDAWQKFESFSDTMVNSRHENRFKRFNFTLNRNIVLPSVFGVIIILFSFLLVNFVSIKSPARENDQKAETQPIQPSVTKPEVKQAVVKQTAPVIEKELKPEEPLTSAPDKTTELKTTENTAISKPLLPVETSVTQNQASKETTSDTAVNEVKPKRKSERRIEAVESQQLNEISPTPISEERDSEIRPE